MEESPRIVIIGGGLAGLTAAYRLNKNGLNAHLYEARKRVGGRIFTASINGSIIELGGQNILDGGDSKNLIKLAEELNLEFLQNKISLDIKYFNGRNLISERELLKVHNFNPEMLKLRLEKLAQKAGNMQEVLLEFFEREDPLYRIMNMRLAAFEGASVEKLSSVYVETLYYMLLGGVCSVHQGDEEAISQMTVKGGNNRLTEKLSESLGNKVHTSEILKSVKKNTRNQYVLSFQEGSTIFADILVLAIPCSVYEDIHFEKGIIPEQRLQAIKKIPYGTNSKIMIPFPRSTKERVAFLDDQVGAFFNADMTALNLYYTQESAFFTSENLLDSYQKGCSLVAAGFGADCVPPRNPVFAIDDSFVTYEGPVAHSWPNDTYAKGSYSYTAPGQEVLFTSVVEEGGELAKCLFTPIDQRLFFAGEHTSVLRDIPGTMEAACESGEKAARMILANCTMHQQASF